MKPIILNSDNSNNDFLYVQLYDAVKEDILSGAMREGEKLPSLRALSKELSISITTVELAYNQLVVEGYIISKPHSGYYISKINSTDNNPFAKDDFLNDHILDYTAETPPYIYDPEGFDFVKWKKCASRVFNECSKLLLFESDPQGEASLRYEISKYIYRSRGVSAHPDRIVIGAGTQQITGHLSRILSRLGIKLVSIEAPGYLPVQNMFLDSDFTVYHIPVEEDGISIGKLPVNIPSAVYVSPSNQFPTGTVMPVGRRYELLDWAKSNHSIIIEDDYDSELRYFGKPVPAMQSLDKNDSVVYLGSFSSTLFPAVKISYMVLPETMVTIFNQIKIGYTQTCSKSEQLTLALFMEYGYYDTGIRKLRSLYARKLEATVTALQKYGKNILIPLNTKSGITMTLKVTSNKTAEELCEKAKSLGIEMVPISQLSDQETSAVSFYYSQLPLQEIEPLIKKLLTL